MTALQKIYTKLAAEFNSIEAIPAQFLEPISAELPCGVNLEYDNDFAVLRARLEPRIEVQYGSFTNKKDEPDWGEIERDCCRLLSRSKDITVLIWYARCRTRSAGAEGLAQGLTALHEVVSKFEREVHPQLLIDDCVDLAVRANALAALCDPDGLLSDIRHIIVSNNTAARLSMRDVERALAVPRLPDAMEPEAVKRQLTDLYRRKDSNLKALLSAGTYVQKIIEWATQNLKEDAPDLQAIQNLLSTLTVFFQGPSTVDVVEPEKTYNVEALVTQMPQKSRVQSANALAEPACQMKRIIQEPMMNTDQQRERIRQLLNETRVWIEQNEPSSPVAILLKQAERVWGKRFSEVANFIPPDLLRAWDEDRG